MKALSVTWLTLSCLTLSLQVFAFPTDRTDITTYDGDSSSQYGYQAYSEDNEVEPGMQISQAWDMEGFFLQTGTTHLGMVSGFNFKDGYEGIKAGDIFIDVNGDHMPGNATTTLPNGNTVQSATTFGYDFVLDIDWASINSSGIGSYTVIQLLDDATVKKTYYQQNYGSGPFEYVSGGKLLGSGSFTYEAGLTSADTGYLGLNHYAAYGFDLSFLNQLGYNNWWVSTTMGCGNDHLLGYQKADVPEPSSLVLLAIGILGLVLARKRA